MSWKGFTKAVYRLPHTLSTKTGFRDETKDPEFIELNNKFTECEKITAALVTEVCKYRDNVTAMLNYQAEFGIVLADIYDPGLGMPSGEVTPRRTQTAPESIQAVNDFQAVMRELRNTLLPEVDKLEMTVVRPLIEMQNNMKLIRKTIIKRDHKMVDYDRYRISLKKLQDKKEKTLSDEKQIYKLESQLEVATADYEGLNSLLREELPGFFYYKTQLMEPIFHMFYFLQLHIYGLMLDRLGPLASNGYFDLTMDVKSGYEARKPDTLVTLESVETITKKSAAATYTSKYARPNQGASPTLGASGSSTTFAPPPPAASSLSPPAPSPKPWEASVAGAKPWQKAAVASAGAKPWETSPPAKKWQTDTTAVDSRQEESSPPPPAYNTVQTRSSPPHGSTSRFNPPQNINIHLAPSIQGTIAATAAAAATSHAINSINSSLQTQASKKGPPPPIPKRLGQKTVLALYDYDAQQEGDLSFRKDDRIELIERTADVNGWWTGKLNGRQGIFPGNYVQEL
ncbi:hypothetical protein B0O80DRAFT_432756 [Mortierella sp. GBAus27b]|nr:hypothetical protein B0O80DRAFT_432756 [Mortierella sp. GBAus27b]